LKFGSTKFWPYASAIVLLAAAAATAVRSQTTSSATTATATNRVNELTLAGLHPGHDTLDEAKRRYGSKMIADSSDGTKQWRDACTGHAIILEVGGNGVIQSVTVSALEPDTGSCNGRRGDVLREDQWQTGHGLRLGDPQDRVTQLYGDPNSSGPSVKGKHELELMFYAFDWAGSSVPQVMEVFCARDSGRVMEITLAYPSL